MSKKVPTGSLLRWHTELLRIAAGRDVLRADEVARVMGCTETAVQMRVFYMRQCELLVPQLTKAPDEFRQQPRKRHHLHKNTRIRRDGISIKVCGSPELPVCPMCEKRGRVSVYGEQVHLTTDGEFQWCEVCGYDTGWQELANSPQKVRKWKMAQC